MSGREEMSDAKFVEPFFADLEISVSNTVMLQSFSNTIFTNFVSAYSIAEKRSQHLNLSIHGIGPGLCGCGYTNNCNSGAAPINVRELSLQHQQTFL